MSLVLQKLTDVRLSALDWVRHSLIWKAFNPFRHWRQYSTLMQWGTELSVVLLSILFAIAPFVSTIQIGLVEIGCAGIWLLLTLSEDAPRPKYVSPVYAVLALYWAWAGMATILSPVKREALNGLVELSLYLIVFALIERTVRSPKWRTWIISIYLFAAFAVTLFGFQQWFFGAPPLATWVDPESSMVNTTRIYSYLGNPNLAAAYLIPAIPLSLSAMFVWPHWGPKLLAAVMFAANTICVVLTFSRGGWIALVVSLALSALLLLYWMLPQLPRFWQVWAFPILLGGGGVLLLVGIIAVPPLRDRVLSIFASRKDSSNNFRINVWEAVKEMIRDRPLTGIGPGHDAFNKIYPLYQRPKFSALSAYSIYLEHLVEFGIFGFTLFMALIATLLHQGWEHLQRLRQERSVQGFWLIAALASMGGLLAHGTVDTVWYRPQVFTLWWLMAAIATSYFVPAQDSK
ncbi:IctB family putative bicarbonate transporter [Altericista sp. CCNU0014]|uniref:IctB family putative bicarbonate transporter n=1 Tax=Altericista sp. CCNU0014 TaxID=3082949 RepID=UPI00384FA133